MSDTEFEEEETTCSECGEVKHEKENDDLVNSGAVQHSYDSASGGSCVIPGAIIGGIIAGPIGVMGGAILGGLIGCGGWDS